MTGAGRGAIVWLTGLPASGKSTLAEAVRARLQAEGLPSALLDGDAVRAALGTAEARGYDEASREAFYGTLGRLALLLARQGLVVLVPATAHRRVWRDRVRAEGERFVEVHVAATPEECAARDVKGLYAAARAGAATDLPGVGVAYEPPPRPEVSARGGRDPRAIEPSLALVRA